MVNNYLGRDLYEKLDKLVKQAFYRIYAHSKDNWYEINYIELDCGSTDSEFDFPFVKVEVSCNTLFDGMFDIELEYHLEESDEFNLGIFYNEFSKIENC